MGVKKQMGNNHVSKINFQKNLIGCGLGAFFFPLLLFLSLSLSPLRLSLPILPSFCSFFFFFFGLGVEIREEKKGGEKARQ